jgi:hypothetical protein
MPSLSQLLGAVVGTIGSDARVGGPQTNHYVRYVSAMVEQALARWGAVSAAGIRCGLEVRRPDGDTGLCGMPAIAACCVCGKTCCLDHAMVSPSEIICASCVVAAKMRFSASRPASPASSQADRGRPFGFVDPNNSPPPPPPPSSSHATGAEERKAALRVLRLKQDSTDEQIRAQYKKLAFENHPDRAKTDRERISKQKRLNEINRAYDTLTKQRKAA